MPPTQFYTILALCMAMAAVIFQLSNSRTVGARPLGLAMALIVATAALDAIAIFHYPLDANLPPRYAALTHLVNSLLVLAIFAVFLGTVRAVFLRFLFNPDPAGSGNR